jgi:hypothetical protein
MTENQITGLLLELADKGITGIKVHYDGSGDSGAIENIIGYYRRENLSLEVLEETSMWLSGLETMDLKNNSVLEDFLYNVLEDVEDWYNNEGGYGYINILVPSGDYSIKNFVRRTETDFFGHGGNLLEKSVK